MGLTPEQIEKLRSRTSAPAVGGGLTPEQLQALQTGQPTAKVRGDIFSGGTFSDILDVLQIPQFAVTGALTPGVTAKEAVQQRLAPGEALGIKSGFGRFAADVILDPLNIVGVGAVTKLGKGAQAAGKAAATLGAAAKAGERSLLTLAGRSIVPRALDEAVFGGVTKFANKLKQNPALNVAAKSFGQAGAAATGKIDDIERIATGQKLVTAEKLKASGVQQIMTEQFVNQARKLRKQADELIDAGTVTRKQYEDIVEKIANPRSSIKIAPELQSTFKTFKSQIDSLNKGFTRLTGGTKLDGKRVKNILTPAAREAIVKPKGFRGGARQVGGAVGSEQFATKVGFKSLDAATDATPIFGEMSGKTAAKLQDGTNLKRVKFGPTEQFYATTRVAEQVDLLKARAKVNGWSAEKLGGELQALKREVSGELYQRSAMSPRQINAALAGRATKFSEDPAAILAAQGGDIAKLRARSNFVKGIAKHVDAGKFGRKVEAGAPVPEGFARSKIKGLENYAFPEELVGHMDKTFKAFSNIEEVNAFVQAYDKLLNLWKGTATFANIAFHTRNSVSNHWQLWLAGMTNPAAHTRGYRIGAQVTKALKEGANPTKYVTPKYKKYVDEFLNDQGLRSTGAFSTDIDKSVSRLQENFVFELGGAAGEWLENGAKMSLYLDRRLKGFTKDAAGMDVRKYLFDYSDLSDFERNVMKRFFPFYTWTRKNIPLQVAMLIDDPTRVNVIGKAKTAIEATRGTEPMDESLLPEWLREAYPIYLGTDPSGLQRFLKLEGFLPTVDLNKIGRPGEVPFEQLSPIIKTPMELVANYDFFFEREIERFEGQKEFRGLVPFTDQGVEIGAKANKLLDLIRPLSELEKLTVDPNDRLQPTEIERLLNVFIGKTSQLSEQKQKDVFDYIQAKTESNIKSDIEAARKRGRTAEVRRLQELLRETEKGKGITL